MRGFVFLFFFAEYFAVASRAPSSGLTATFSPAGEKDNCDCPLSTLGERAKVRGLCFCFSLLSILRLQAERPHPA